MTTSKKRKSPASHIRIEGEMTIYRAAELRQTLVDALEKAEELEVDLAAVTEIDTAGIQILMALKKLALAKQKKLRLMSHSQQVLEVLEMLNLAPYFGDPMVMA